jgi:HemY protein
MIRIVLFLVALSLVAAGFAWFADRPGDIVLTWQGYRVETSLLVALVALIVLILLALAAWSILRAIVRTPENVSLFFRHRRAMRGYQAITRGLIAIGASDRKLARRSADDARRLSPGEPLALLLEAQAAQISGDRAGAERAFRAMTRRDETRLLGLRGLYIEAQRASDHATARKVAEEAIAASPALGWAGEAVLDERCAAGDWAGALETLERMRPGLEKPEYRRKRAVLLTARALALNEIDRDASRDAVLEAVKLAPDLAPAAALAGRRLAESNEPRKARRVLERAWQANPHPDIAEAYANVRLGDSARERLARMQKLAEKMPGQREGALAVARAALEAREFETARNALAPFLSAPTQHVAALMAEIEEAEHGDTGRVREWMSRAVHASGDPVWTADGVVSDRWLPVSPNGRLDGFEWKVPLAEIGVTRPVIEVHAPEAELSQVSAAASEPRTVPERPASSQNGQRDAASAAKEPPVEPVIPLVHAPDDPGPEGNVETDVAAETVPPSEGQRWPRKIKDLFK